MLGKRTAVILGAGASYCYGGGSSGIPIQQDIIGKLFNTSDVSSGEGMVSFAGPSGLMHSFRLGQFLRRRFDIPEEPHKRGAKLDFWTALQERGFNLESLYADLEAELQGEFRVLLSDFEAIVRSSVLSPVGERGIESVCPHHRKLCEALEPGDYVVNFNWDSVMADTLLYCSHYWFPASGFGVGGIYPLLPRCQKAGRVNSLVQLFQIHGSVLLYELEDPENPDQHLILFRGPRQYSATRGWLELQGISLEEVRARGLSSFGTGGLPPDQSERLLQGHMFLDGKWFKPLFVPPSKHKPLYRHRVFKLLLSELHSVLPATEHFLVIGYSFPEADCKYLREIFVPDVINGDATGEIINPENDRSEFQDRVRGAFPSLGKIVYGEPDFRTFCANLDVQFPDRPRAG
jgi:hypothetical protein